MPVKTAIQLHLRCMAKENLDSGPGLGPGQALRQNDEFKTVGLWPGSFRK